MGHLRARNESEKAVKRKAILDAAWALLKDSDGQLPTVIEIANHAQVSKGTVYVYFKTKEEIFLDLFVAKLQEWVADLKRILPETEQPSIHTFSSALTEYPTNHPLILALGGLLHGVLEKNAPLSAIVDMKAQVAGLVDECGQLFNQYFPWLPPRQGAKFMLTAYTVFSGIFQSAASCSEELKNELKKKGIDIFEVDVKTDMVKTSDILLEGIRAVLSN